MTATLFQPVASPRPRTDRLLSLETPFGRPVHWAAVALVSDPGDSHELNDDRCLVVTSRDLRQAAGSTRRATSSRADFMLCVLADGATGSTFNSSASEAGESGDDVPEPAGWRASQLAQAAFVERFLSSAEVDILDQLKDGLRAADQALTDSDEGVLSTTLVALFLSADGTAYAASIGDSVLLVLPTGRRTPDDRRLQKLGYEDSTSVGSGDTAQASIDQDQLIEQWWPHKESGTAGTLVEPGTYLVLLSDGISDNLPAAAIDRLLHRHPLDRATVGLPLQTRELRLQAQKLDGAPTQRLGLDNMSAIVVRFDGPRGGKPPAAATPVADATLTCVFGTHGGPTADAGGQFGMICLAEAERGLAVMPAFVRHFIESEHHGDVPERLEAAFTKARPCDGQPRFAVLAIDNQGASHAFSAGGASVGRAR